MTLRPVHDNNAQENVRVVFEDAKRLLHMSAVPLMLRFVANAPAYLLYLWERMEFDLQSKEFLALSEKLTSFSNSSLAIIYTPSPEADLFSSRLSQKDREELGKFIENLLHLNSIFFLFSLDLREDLKTAFTKTEEVSRLPEGAERFYEQVGSSDKAVSVTTSRMLAPLFGSALPVLPSVETFFSVVDSEAGKLGRTEAYLKTRVELERVGLMLLPLVPRRMNSNYKVFMELVEDGHVAYDLLYLLTNVFPSEFPRLLLTTALMQRLLQKETGIVTR